MENVRRERPRKLVTDPLVSGVMRAVAELPEPDRSVINLRYGIKGRPLDEEEAAAQLGMTVRELWQTESLALEMVGFLLITEMRVFRFFQMAA